MFSFWRIINTRHCLSLDNQRLTTRSRPRIASLLTLVWSASIVDMDAVGTAIGLAGSALKLVIFADEFVSDAKHVYRLGATDRNLDLATVAQSVQTATETLQDQLANFDQLNSKEGKEKPEVAAEDDGLSSIAARAADIGGELAAKLRKVSVDEQSKWKSFKAVVRGLWDAEEIQKIEKRLDGIRSELQLRIVIDLREKVVASRNDEYRRMLENLERVAADQADSKDASRRMIEMLNTMGHTGDGRHNELLDLGNQVLDGINTLARTRSPSPLPTATLSADFMNGLLREKAEKKILNQLWYSTIKDREETISEAHTRTFQWIYEDPQVTGKPWSSFTDFLRSDARSYWITGKPGSGKSTLMKYINEIPLTVDHLQHWSKDRQLLMIPYYFFYNGGKMQKSEIGLLRSILHSMLSQERGLIPIAFPERYQAALDDIGYPDPSLPEAKKALKRVLRESSHLCFFIAIDGLDEFDPNSSSTLVSSLIGLTFMIREFENVKLLVSSRPLTEFEFAYADCPSLKVQDLTKGDITLYIQDRLGVHPKMESLLKREPERSTALMDSIAEGSSGVFLWVKIVTESVVSGLINHDGIEDLEKRLAGLPSDIQELYKTMLVRVEPKYRQQTARLLALVYDGTWSAGYLSVLGLWFAERVSDQTAIDTEVTPLYEEEVTAREAEMEIRCKSRCLGLVEVQDPPPNDLPIDGIVEVPKTRPDGRVRVNFLHRSVFEFLGAEGVYEEFISSRYGQLFEPASCLFRSAVMDIKTCNLAGSSEILAELMEIAGHRAQYANKFSEHVSPELLSELDTAITKIRSRPVATPPTSTKGPCETTDWEESPHWSCWLNGKRVREKIPRRHFTDMPDCAKDRTHGSLMVFAVHHGLTCYVEGQISRHGLGVLQKEGMPLLGHALLRCSVMNQRLPPSPPSIKLLLGHGASPHSAYNGIPIWDLFLDALDTQMIVDWMLQGVDIPRM
ncbi:hypothetical protein F4780DRAFT_395085 [Xylariomycetidae sp. FL0641]|nr:hypothetical protein F4780DRAFT_395085 [Xylariomycetidae sp. FL0641]